MTAVRKSSRCSSVWATSRQGHTSRPRWRACANSPSPASPPCMARHCAEPISARYSQRSNGPAGRYRDIDHRLRRHKCGYRSATPRLACPGILLHTAPVPPNLGNVRLLLHHDGAGPAFTAGPGLPGLRVDVTATRSTADVASGMLRLRAGAYRPQGIPKLVTLGAYVGGSAIDRFEEHQQIR